MKPKNTAKRKLQRSHVIAAAAVILLLGIVTYVAWPHLSAFTDPERAKAFIAEAGPAGPLVFMGLQILQVFVAPIPGQVTGLVGGFLFGPWLGLLYALIGATIGFTLIFLLVRKLGRPFVERFVDKKTLDKFDYIAGSKGVFVLFLVFLLPAFPDDLICYIAGLTKIPIRTLVLVSLAGRLPVYAILSFAGDGLAGSNLNPIIALTLAAVGLFAMGLWKRAWLQRFVRQENHLVFLKQQLSRANRKMVVVWTIITLVSAGLLIWLATSSVQLGNLFGA